MAISSGFGPHFAQVSTSGGTFLLEEGSVTLKGDSSTGSFRGRLPMGLPGAYETFANMGENTSSMIATTRGATGVLITGPIKKIDINFIAGVIDFQGQDQGAKLHDTQISQNFPNMTGAAIVSMVAGQAGLPVSIEGGGGLMAGKTVDQQNYNKLADGITAAEVIQQVAQLDGATWWVDAQGTLHYSTSGVSGGGLSVTYNPGPPKRADFEEMTIEINVDASKTQNVTVPTWHPGSKQAHYGRGIAGGRVAGTKSTNMRIANLLQDHADAYAQSKARAIARHGVTVVVRCVGDPSLTSMGNLSVSGTGALDGSYKMDEIHHGIGMRGHIMTITARTPT